MLPNDVMFAARCPSKPIICSLMLAGARCWCPSASDTRYFCWYCHGANRWRSVRHLWIVSGFSLQCWGAGLPLSSGAGVVKQWNRPPFCMIAGAVKRLVSSGGCRVFAMGLRRRGHGVSVCVQWRSHGVSATSCGLTLSHCTDNHHSRLRCMMPPSSASTTMGSTPSCLDNSRMSCCTFVCGTTFSMRM